MFVSVNKNSVAKRPISYAALASGTVSHVWSEEEPKAQKRQVRIASRAAKPEIKAPRDGK